LETLSTELILFAAALAGAGVLAGLVAGLLGVGGGLVVVPVVYSALGITDMDALYRMHVSVATSLALIIPTSVRSASEHYRRGAVDPALLRRWALPMMAGVAAGVLAASALPSAALSLLFAAVVLAMAAYLGLTSARAPTVTGTATPSWRTLPIPFSVGTLSTMMGIGGGSLSVPAMSWLGYAVHRAVGTSAAFGLLIALPGTLGFVLSGWGRSGLPPGSLGFVNLIALGCLLPTTLLCVPLGVRLAHRLPERPLKLAFAGFLLLVGLRMLAAALTVR
jgi:uncharacterized protein